MITNDCFYVNIKKKVGVIGDLYEKRIAILSGTRLEGFRHLKPKTAQTVWRLHMEISNMPAKA